MVDVPFAVVVPAHPRLELRLEVRLQFFPSVGNQSFPRTAAFTFLERPMDQRAHVGVNFAFWRLPILGLPRVICGFPFRDERYHF